MNPLNNISIQHNNATISNDDPQSQASISALSVDNQTLQDIETIQAVVDHINEIQNWEERIASLKYLADLSAIDAKNISFEATDQMLKNSITSLSGNPEEVDLTFIKSIVAVVLEWHDWTALNSLSGGAGTNA